LFLASLSHTSSTTKITVYSSFLSLTVEKTISYDYLSSLLVPIIWGVFGGVLGVFWGVSGGVLGDVWGVFGGIFREF
jgi:hypothetical protein